MYLGVYPLVNLYIYLSQNPSQPGLLVTIEHLFDLYTNDSLAVRPLAGIDALFFLWESNNVCNVNDVKRVLRSS